MTAHGGLEPEDIARIVAAALGLSDPVYLQDVAVATSYSPSLCGHALRAAGWRKVHPHRGPKHWLRPDPNAPRPDPNAIPPSRAIARNPDPSTVTGRSLVRVAVPDSHGAHIDEAARDAFLRDLARLDPDEVVMLGDHLDCGGTFSAHQRTYTNEMTESYEEDIAACNVFLDAIQAAAPRAQLHYLEGNHEQHVERWAAREFHSKKDADKLLQTFGPEAVLKLADRGIRYYRRAEHYTFNGEQVSIPGTIRLGKVFFTHGIAHSKSAAQVHVERFGANVVFGHVHRSQSVVERSVTSDARGAWCPGTLAKLQPLYRHTAPSNWTHGFAIQFINASGSFLHLNIPIFRGTSMLGELLERAA